MSTTSLRIAIIYISTIVISKTVCRLQFIWRKPTADKRRNYSVFKHIYGIYGIGVIGAVLDIYC